MDEIVRRSLIAFAKDVAVAGWSGRREREAVSLYVLRYLAAEVAARTVLHDVAQIGVEVPVPQLPKDSPVHRTENPKPQVCKDIVVWPKPAMTCWDKAGQPTVYPTAVIQWKSAGQPDRTDVDWLRAYSLIRPDFVGFAVATSGYGGSFLLRCAKVVGGRVVPDWLECR
jgi:hypothetical protein